MVKEGNSPLSYDTIKDFAINPSITIDSESSNLPDYRTQFMRDRDRILYCRPFLRLAGKTQVYGTGYDDHARNRLTHSLEVAQIGKTIAAALNQRLKNRIDVDLVEAIALGHDLGHAPYGHAGEREINDILCFKNDKINRLLGFKYITSPSEMVNARQDNPRLVSVENNELINSSKGFKHNWQSVRIVTDLSRDHKLFDMELSKVTLAGMLFHSKLHHNNEIVPPFYKERYLRMVEMGSKVYLWSLEVLIVALADEIAQRHHDIEDAISCHYLTPNRVVEMLKNEISDLERKAKEFKEIPHPVDFTSILALIQNENVEANEVEIVRCAIDTELFVGLISKCIVNWLVTDCIKTSSEKIEELLVSNREIFEKSILVSTEEEFENDIYREIIAFSPTVRFADKLLQYRLKTIVLNSRNVQRMDKKGCHVIRKLFEAYVSAPQQMPDKIIFAIFREYLRNYHSKELKNFETEERYLFKDAADARVALEYCYPKEFSMMELTEGAESEDIEQKEIIFSVDRRVELSYVKFRLSLLRVIADYVSGMTDSYAENEYRKLYGIDRDIEAY